MGEEWGMGIVVYVIGAGVTVMTVTIAVVNDKIVNVGQVKGRN